MRKRLEGEILLANTPHFAVWDVFLDRWVHIDQVTDATWRVMLGFDGSRLFPAPATLDRSALRFVDVTEESDA